MEFVCSMEQNNFIFMSHKGLERTVKAVLKELRLIPRFNDYHIVEEVDLEGRR